MASSRTLSAPVSQATNKSTLLVTAVPSCKRGMVRKMEVAQGLYFQQTCTICTLKKRDIAARRPF
ncbi:hypothetical protein BDV36DRAFT_260269, partial [Aspergillus pseudocaelatus]